MSDPSKNQPIATLSPLSKFLERVIYDQLVKYLDEHDVIFKNPWLEKKPFHWASDYGDHW